MKGTNLVQSIERSVLFLGRGPVTSSVNARLKVRFVVPAQST
jgi:hypothetical protein